MEKKRNWIYNLYSTKSEICHRKHERKLGGNSFLFATAYPETETFIFLFNYLTRFLAVEQFIYKQLKSNSFQLNRSTEDRYTRTYTYNDTNDVY